MNAEKANSELKKQLREAEMRKEEALSKQTELSVQIQSLKIAVIKSHEKSELIFTFLE